MTGDLGSFLRARRAHVQPSDVGVRSLGTRRVAGLRREEVAMLAGVSVDYLARLEQGRETSPSPAVLNALGRALCLDHEAAAHLFRLAGLAPAPRQPAPTAVDPALVELLESWPTTPALIINPQLDVLAANRLARALYSDFERVDNVVRMTFVDPAGARFFLEWERAAESCVANLRLALGMNPTDDGILALITEAHDASAHFRRLWAQHEVRGKTQEAKRFHHSELGEITLAYRAFDVRGAVGHELITYQAAAGSVEADKLRLLGTLAVTPR